MKKINFVNNSEPALSAENLNQMQDNMEEVGVVVSPTEPTTNEKVWIQKGKNLFNSNLIIKLANCTDNNGTIKQNEADTNSNLSWKVQTFKDGVFISNSIVLAKNDIGKISLTFIKLSTFNEVAIGLNGFKIDTLVVLNASKLIDGETYTISFEITNVTQGSISWKNIQIEQNTEATEYEEYIEKKIYCKNDNGVFEEFVNAEEIKDTGWISLNSQIKYRKKNGTVFVKGISEGSTTIGNAQYTNVGTLPEGFKPNEGFYFIWTGMGGDINNQSAKIETNGEISLYLPSGKTTSYWAFIISFPI